jgi:mono/diheme cytochrome c family protein
MPPAKVEPGRDPEMAARTKKLNLLFAATSIGLLAAFSLMVWADYDREWKKHQIQFNRLEVKLTKEQRDAALGKVDAAKAKALEAQIEEGRREIAARADEVRKARAEVERLKGVWYRVDQDFRFTKARIDVARYEYEEAAHEGEKSASARKKHLDELEVLWQQFRLDREKVEADQAATNAKLAELEGKARTAEKEQQELYAEKTRLDARIAAIQPGFVSLARNLPIIDMANPSLKVNQIIPAHLQDDVIFTTTPKVDRCTTCHLGIDKKGYETAPQPFTTHPNVELFLAGPHSIEKVGCTVCHQGRGRATSFKGAVHTASTREQEKAWGKYTGTKEYERWHLWDLPMMAKGNVESQCLKCHRGVVEVPRAEKLNVGNLLVEKYGCFGCHKIKGWEGLRKVGPDLAKIASKTSEEWMVRWVQEPRSFRHTRMPQIWGVRTADQQTPEVTARDEAEINAVVSYLVEHSARREYPAPPPGDLQAGRKTFETVGCLACHRVGDDRRGIEGLDAAAFREHGPNLEGSGSKLEAGWLYAWIRDPKAYWHDTKMPNLRLTEKEAADITAYLMSLKSEGFAERPRPANDAKARDAVVLDYLKNQYSVAQAEARLAAMDDHARTAFLGEKTIARYGCFGCHNVPGFEKASPIGTELTEEGSKLVERLDFGFEEGKIPHSLPGWVHRKLMEPRTFDQGKLKRHEELLRMPKFHFTPEEADALVTAVMSMTKEQIPLAAQRQLSAEEKLVERGRRLVRNYNCQGCHQVGEKGGAIKAIIEDQLDSSGGDTLQAAALAPPMLYNARAQIGEGARVQTPWLHGFLQDPSNEIRPWLDVRMPTFQFTEEQTNAITQYFATLDKVPYPYEPKPQPAEAALLADGKELFEKWQCVKCHVVAGKLPNQEPANMAPDLAKVPSRLRADWIDRWLTEPTKIQPGTRMPTNFPEEPSENAFPEILGGDQRKQIEAVRAYLLTLGPGGRSASLHPPVAPRTPAVRTARAE